MKDPQGAGRAGQGPILVVDDDADGLACDRVMLEKAGYAVAAVPGARAAREELDRQDFAVVVADLRLADGSGLEVLADARERRPLSVGLIVTAYSSLDSALQALREGVFDYVLKPFTEEVLQAAVRRALEHHRVKAELARQTARLEELQTRLDRHLRLLENISHEFKNPLSVVYGYATHLLRQQNDPARAKDIQEGLSTIRKGAQRLTALLGELLDTVQLSNRKLELDVETVSAWGLIQEAVLEHSLGAQARGLSLECAGEDPGLTVRADVRRVQQVLTNLVYNALKFTRPGGQVRVSIAPDEGFVRFCVRDTGVGISPPDLALIFERFYQAGKPADQQPGLGLGLEISRGLVELHGGRIWAESVLDRGSSFYFTLPAGGAEGSRPA
ncbi:MAG: ATP-binding protein [Elusimicrobia bacterium]|nr:ATP-binding protein [Elusimicrobiota bacterium]